MVQKTCAPLPLADLYRFRSRMSRREKVRRCHPLLEAAPEPLREQLIERIQYTSDVNRLLNDSRLMQREVCSHAALALLLDPVLHLPYAIALYQTEERYHDLIIATVASRSKCSSNAVAQFLSEIEFDGLEAAMLHALERESGQLFERPKHPACNRDPYASLVRKFLFEVASTSKDDRRRLLAAKWIPYFTSSDDECVKILEQLLRHHSADLRAMVALQISFIKKDYPRLRHHLWSPLEYSNWCGTEFVSVHGMNGRLQKVILKRLVDLACESRDLSDMQQTSDRWAQFWCNQITSMTPVDRGAFSEATCSFYRFLRLPQPRSILFFESPRQAAVAAAIYHSLAEEKNSFRNSFSKADDYIQKFIHLIDRFPAPAPEFRKPWTFGAKGVVPNREYEDERYLPWCGTYFSPSPERNRDIWDVIADYDHELENEMNRALETLSNCEAVTSVSRMPYVKSAIGKFMHNILNHERLGMVGYRSVLKQIGACPHSFDGLEQLLQICPSFIAFDDLVIACERPVQITRNAQGQLHNITGQSIEFADGWGVYSAQGMSVTPNIILQPQTITVKQIINEWNLEIRRFMLEQYGIERFIEDSGAELIDQSVYGALYHMPMERDRFNMVRVRNSTAEPDGSFRTYFISVPPNTKTAREAVAWTFEMEESEYQPSMET